MIISDHIQVYLKTTETCNLNCDHCFTNGRNGAKVFFNPDKSIAFLSQLFSLQRVKGGRILFHGGEPMLAPIQDMRKVYNYFKANYSNVEFGIQTNLTYKLTDERLEFLNDLFLKTGLGTSWDHEIRFESFEQMLLWEKNVRTLVDAGHKISVMVSLHKKLIETYSAKDLCLYFSDLGIKHVLFERITSNGNATLNPDIQPQNKDLDQWLLQMYEDTIEHKLYKRIHNMFLEEIAIAVLKEEHTANRCRNCEQSLFTINATGTISGCPNSAPTEFWGDINKPLDESLNAPGRICTILCETEKNSVCKTCPVNMICNGDCHRLPWQENICAAPKSLMMKMKKEKRIEDYQNLLF